MATTAVTLNGVTYYVPQPGEQGPTYDQDLTNYLIALATAFPQGGASPSSTFQALVSASANPASAGQLRLAQTDNIRWRNAANTNNVSLGLDSLNDLSFFDAGTGITTQITGQPFLNAYVTVAQTGISGATTIKFDTVVTDTDSAYNAGTGIYTVPTGKGGQYLIACSLLLSVATAISIASLNIAAGGNTVATSEVSNQVIGVGATALAASTVVTLTAGQTISANVAASGGTVSTVASSRATQLSIKRLV